MEKFSTIKTGLFICVALLWGFVSPVSAEMSGMRAHILSGEYDDYMFQSAGNQVLIATLVAQDFQSKGRMGEEHDHAEDSFAADYLNDSSDTESLGCSGGPGGFCLQVLNDQDEVICWAGRPATPGWKRDPNLACPIPETRNQPEDFTLRVFLRAHGEFACSRSDGYPDAENEDLAKRIYQLNTNLIAISEPGKLPGGDAARK